MRATRCIECGSEYPRRDRCDSCHAEWEWTRKVDQMKSERDEAKAEVERLREMNATQVELVQKARDEEQKARQTITHERAKRRADVRLMEIERDRAREHADLLMRRLDELYAEQPRWIPVEERLPEDGQHVLAWVVTGVTDPHARTLRYRWQSFNDEHHDYWHVTHWMPLPEPPEVER